jgi:peptidoglycan/LPS O-acetylase OafA/YrhL
MPQDVAEDIQHLPPTASSVKSSGSPASRQIFGLDLIRFAAALLVMMHHLGFAIWAKGYVATSYTYLGPYVWSGWIGVEIFFVLSGFIIAYSAQGATASGFVKNRFLRLYPAAWICSCLTLAVVLLNRQPVVAGAIFPAWLRCMVLSPHGPYLDGSYWTLPVEVTFYAAVFGLLLLGRIRALGLMMSVVGVFGAVSWMYGAAYSCGLIQPGGRGLHYLGFFFRSSWLTPLVFTNCCFFTIGTLLWLCLFERVTVSRIVVLLICVGGALAEIREHAHAISFFFGVHYSMKAPFIEWSLAVAAIIFSVRWNVVVGRWLGVRGAAVARRLGLITYPLYLIHQEMGMALISRLHTFMPDLVALILTMIVMIAAAFAIHSWLEKPLQRFLRERAFHSKRQMPAPAGTLP